MFSTLEGDENDEFDKEAHALLAKMNGDPQNYREALNRPV